MLRRTQSKRTQARIIRPFEKWGHMPRRFKFLPFEQYDHYVLSFSGGKDSLVLLLWALEKIPRQKLEIIYCDTGMNPSTDPEYLAYVEKKLDVKINILGPPREPHDAWSFLIRNGWPSGGYRWCTQELKLALIKKYLKEKGYYLSPKILNLTGERADESTRRGKYINYTFNRYLKTISCRPLLKLSEVDDLNYIKSHDMLLNPTYRTHTRHSCACCFLQNRMNSCCRKLKHRSYGKKWLKWRKK